MVTRHRWRAVLSRVVRLVATFALVTFGATLLLSLTPGDPAYYIAGEFATPEVVEAVRQDLNLDDSVPKRYVAWLGDFVQGDLGVSIRTRVPVTNELRERLPVTLEIVLLATILSYAVAVPLAIAAARRAGSAVDRWLTKTSITLISAPNFAIAITLAYLFGVRWQVLPLVGWTSFSDDISDNLRTAIMPVIAVAVAPTVVIFRVLRADLVSTLRQDYIALARAKGLSQRRILWYHALKPSVFSVLTLFPLQLAGLVAGSVVVESIFGIPGMGLLLFNAVTTKDLVVVQATIAIVAIVVLFGNALVDLLYGVLDPRTRVSK